MQNTLNFPPLRPAETESRTTFNVVIAYEDLETGKHAKKTYDFLQEHLGHEFEFSNQMWKFDVLSVPKLREMAAKDAVTADIIIVAAHGQSDLPKEVKAWIELWMPEKLQAIALVGLFDREECFDNPARSYLAGIADRASLEFFSQPGSLPRNDESISEIGAWEKSKTFSVLAGMEQMDRNVSHWGINE